MRVHRHQIMSAGLYMWRTIKPDPLSNLVIFSPMFETLPNIFGIPLGFPDERYVILAKEDDNDYYTIIGVSKDTACTFKKVTLSNIIVDLLLKVINK